MTRHLFRFSILVALGFAGAAGAADVGRVLLAAGDTVAIRDSQTVKLTFGTAIQDKDVLRTGPASNLQVRFTDESIVSMKESSELRIEDFQFSGKEDGNERAFFRLIKGGLRTVTGLIGRANHKNYQMSTTTATIGIRGTDYAAMLCQGDCRNNDGSLAKDGLYGRTLGMSHGTNRVDVTNERDQKTFGINENFYVADSKSLVQPLLVAPDFLSNRLESRKQGGSKGETGGSGTERAVAGGAAAESRPSTTPEPLPQLQFVATQDLNPQGTTAVLPPANGWVAVYPLPPNAPLGSLIFDDSTTLGTINGLNQLTAYGTPGTFPSGSLSGGSITDTGSLTLNNGQVITWGRWTGNTLVTASDGTTFTGIPVLFGTASGLTGSSVVGTLGGVATYTYAGGPKPVDAGGNVGSITSTSAKINFTNLTADFSLGINFPSIVAAGVNTGPAVFSVSGIGSVSQGMHTGEFFGGLSGTCTGTGCYAGTGPAAGIFNIGLAGTAGYEFAVIGGVLVETQTGDVAFLNAYQSSSFTPGPAPGLPGLVPTLAGVVAFGDATAGVNIDDGALASSGNVVLSGTGASQIMTSFNFPSNVTIRQAASVSGAMGLAGTDMVGYGPAVNAHWGRWVNGSVTEGALPTLIPATGIHYLYADITPTSVLYDVVGVATRSGTFTYNWLGSSGTTIGGTMPTDSSGNIASSHSFGPMSVNFVSRSATLSSGTWNIAGVTHSFSNIPLAIQPQAGGVTLIGGQTNPVGCSGGACSTGSSATLSVSGGFAGATGNHAGLAFSSTSPAGKTASAQVFFCPACP